MWSQRRVYPSARVLLLALAAGLGIVGAQAQSWKPVGSADGITPAGVAAVFVSLALDPLDGGKPYLAYVSNSLDATARVMRYEGGKWVLLELGTATKTDSAQVAIMSKGRPWLAYRISNMIPGQTETQMLNVRAWLPKPPKLWPPLPPKPYAEGKWPSVGVPHFAVGVHFSFAVGPDGTAVVAFSDWENEQKLSVMTYSAAFGWQYVGPSRAATTTAVSDVKVAVSYKKEVYVVFSDYASPTYQGRLLKFLPGKTGGIWKDLGLFSKGQASGLDLVCHPKTGHPNIAYLDGGLANQLTVVAYEGGSPGSFIPKGPSGWSGTFSGYNSLAFDAAGQLHIAYQCEVDGTQSKICVRKYTGLVANPWVPVGAPGFSKKWAFYINLKFYNMTPYVAFQDYGAGNGRAVVYKYY